ncbi:chaperonin 10-like protein [Calycina marina]|uniref:Chaperonin 10-like protein n=1 Tax=Calycina marina TaxID=1763456 RepID=A0A9P7Z0J6_9HELO|nr:chaperonin 10-like protein [Calycina marina]
MPSFTVYKGTKEGKIVSAQTTREVGANEVLVKITHSGLCGTDLHYKTAGIALGHEGAGIVAELGAAVTSFQKGDSVGWGYQHNSCLACKKCLTGHETLCAKRAMYGYADFDQASMGTYAVWSANFLFAIPASIDRKFAAPLMCGGATVFSALQSSGCKPTDRVGVIGVGGLGHLAIQFAAKMGCEIVVFSGTESKKDEAMRLGASEFYAVKGKETLDIGRGIDHLLVTTSAQPDWKLYLSVLNSAAVIYPLSVASDDFVMPYMPIIEKELRIQGSLVAARQVHRDMLTFAAHHKIQPMIEEFEMSEEGIEQAIAKLESGGMRYRGVLVVKE